MPNTRKTEVPGAALTMTWRTRLGHSLRLTGELIGVSASTVYHAELGTRPLTLNAAVALAELTEDEVPVTAWVPRSVLREQRARRTPASLVAALSGRRVEDVEVERRGDPAYEAFRASAKAKRQR